MNFPEFNICHDCGEFKPIAVGYLCQTCLDALPIRRMQPKIPLEIPESLKKLLKQQETAGVEKMCPACNEKRMLVFDPPYSTVQFWLCMDCNILYILRVGDTVMQWKFPNLLKDAAVESLSKDIQERNITVPRFPTIPKITEEDIEQMRSNLLRRDRFSAPVLPSEHGFIPPKPPVPLQESADQSFCLKCPFCKRTVFAHVSPGHKRVFADCHGCKRLVEQQAIQEAIIENVIQYMDRLALFFDPSSRQLGVSLMIDALVARVHNEPGTTGSIVDNE